MTPDQIYQQIHSAIVTFWSMFINMSITTPFEILCANILVVLTGFFMGFIILFIPLRIVKQIFECC